MSFSSLKRNKADFTKLQEKLEAASGKKSYKDPRFFELTQDKLGNGWAIIRFLPPSEGEELPFVRLNSHGFRYNGQWFIEDCPTTIGGACPVCEHNSALYNSTEGDPEANKRMVSGEGQKNARRWANRRFIANIYIVNDPSKPENNGKVMLYNFGPKLLEKITDKATPAENSGDDPIDIFDFWSGADFKLRVSKKAGNNSYDKSEFLAPAPLLDGNDAELEKVYNSQYKLAEFHDPKRFKSYDELKARFEKVIGVSTPIVVGSPGSVAKAPEPRSVTRAEPPIEELEELSPDVNQDDLKMFADMVDD